MRRPSVLQAGEGPALQRDDSTRFAGVWVCGTDTGVGKTVVSSGLVRALAGRGCRVTGLKPVVSGSLAGMHPEELGSTTEGAFGGAACWEDLLRLSVAGGVPLDDEQRSVYRLQCPAAPQFAAAAEGVVILPEHLLAETRRAARTHGEFAVVEGVGGLRVPLAPGYDSGDFARDLGLSAVLVVGIRLGCINHALLTGEALAARGIPLVAWVANAGLVAGYAHLDETVAAIEEGLGVQCAARLPAMPGGESLPAMGPVPDWLVGVEAQVREAASALSSLAALLWSRSGNQDEHR